MSDADILDSSATRTQEETQRAIDNIRKKANVDTSNPSCLCFNCGGDVPATHRWCDSQCRDNYLARDD